MPTAVFVYRRAEGEGRASNPPGDAVRIPGATRASSFGLAENEFGSLSVDFTGAAEAARPVSRLRKPPRVSCRRSCHFNATRIGNGYRVHCNLQARLKVTRSFAVRERRSSRLAERGRWIPEKQGNVIVTDASRQKGVR